MTPKRWYVYVVDLEPRIGSKPGKQRPCLAIQPSEFGENGLDSTVILPLTTKTLKKSAFPLRVKIPKGVCRLEKSSEIMVDQILAWDNSLFARELGKLPEAIVDETKIALKDFLDL